MLHAHYKNADKQTRKAIDEMGQLFSKSVKIAKTPALEYLKHIALCVFLVENEVINRCNSAIVSGLIDEDDAYQTYIDVVTVQQIFLFLNDWQPPNLMHPH